MGIDLSRIDLSRVCKRIESEIRECEAEIESSGPGGCEIVIAEKEALQAEIASRKARYKLDDMNDRLAYIYQRYGELGITRDNWEDYLMAVYSDFHDYIKRRDFLEPMLDPAGVVRKMKYLTERANTTERVWVEKLDIWYGKQTGKAKKHDPPGGNECRVKAGLSSKMEKSTIGLGIALMEVTNLKVYNLARVGEGKIKKVKGLVLVRCKEGVGVIDCRNGKIREMELDEYLSSDLIFKRKGLTGLILGIGQHKNGFGITPGISSITANGKVFKVVFALEGLCAATIHSQDKV
jgi:hypothetical protein